MKKFQLVYSLVDKDVKIVFVGTTSSEVEDIIADCTDSLDVDLSVVIDSVIYEPLNPNQNEQEEKS